jgi:hypothetical protein
MLPNIYSRYERMRCSRIKQHNCRSVIDEKHINNNIRSFLHFFHGHMIDSPSGVVLLGSNRNRVGSAGRGRCSYSGLIGTSARIGASVGVMSLFTTIVAPTICSDTTSIISGFVPKQCTHRMHDPRSIVPHIQPKSVLR